MIGLMAATGGSAGPALASATSTYTIPANFSKLPAAWHGYAPPATRAALAGRAKVSPAAVAAAPALVCSGAEAVYNGNSGLVIEVYASSTAAGGIVDQWGYDGTQTQHWCFFQLTSYQNFPVYEMVNNNSGLCLDIPSGNMVNGQHVQQWPCNGTVNQEWLFENFGNYDTLTSFHSPAGQTGYPFPYQLEVYGSSNLNGGAVDIWQNDNTTTQTWCPGTACKGTGSTGLCVDNASAGNQCSTDFTDPDLAGAAEISPSFEGIDSQWTYPNTNGSIGAIETFQGQCLQVNAAGNDTVRVAPCVNDAAERWINKNAGNGRIIFISVYDSTRCLSADYDDGILKIDPCQNGTTWWQDWGTS